MLLSCGFVGMVFHGCTWHALPDARVEVVLSQPPVEVPSTLANTAVAARISSIVPIEIRV